MRPMCFKTLAILLFAVTTSAIAADVSLVSGIYQKESSKVNDTNSGSTSTFGLGGRFMDDLGETLAWYGDASLAAESYSAADGRKSPGNALNTSLGGGVRHYFKPFTTGIVPYAQGGGHLRNAKSVVWGDKGYSETTTNGLYYDAAIGIRTGLDANFFIDLELPLFDRALFAVAKKTSVSDATATAPASETKDETTYNELWVSSTASLMAARVALGYKF